MVPHLDGGLLCLEIPRLQADHRERVRRVLSVGRLSTQDRVLDTVLAQTPLPGIRLVRISDNLVALDVQTLDQLLRGLGRRAARLEIGLVERVEVLVEPTRREVPGTHHRVQSQVHQPQGLHCLVQCARRPSGHPSADL